MRDPRPYPSHMGWRFLSCATACLASGSAFAGSSLVVNRYINVNPIAVCFTDGTGCPQVNDGTAAIGFFDSKANRETTDEILTKELADATGGTRVVFGPLQKFNSPINPVYNTTFQTLHFAQSPDCNNLLSDDFNTLVQTFNLVKGSNPPAYTVPNPTIPGPNKACTVTNGILQPTCVPISSHPTTVNVFFVNRMVLPSGCNGTLTGFGKVNGNGVAINAPVVFQISLLDVFAHEMTHNLGQTHVATTSNLMAPGGSRTEPTYANLSTGLGVSFDALNTTQTGQVLDPNGIVNLIQEVTTTIKAAPPPATNTFLVTVSIPANNTGAPVSVTNMFWEVPPPLGFQPNTFTVTNNPDNLNVTARNFQGNLGNNIFCGPGSFKCLEIDINSTQTNPFDPGDSFTFSIQMSNSNKNTTLGQLAGVSDFTYLTSDQFTTTSTFEFSDAVTLTADSTVPDFTIAAFIFNLNNYTPLTNTPCAPTPSNQCPNLQISDFQ